MEVNLFLAVIIGIAILLFLILKLRIHAFIALLIGSIAVGLIAGLDANQIINTVQKGMGGTLGFVATVVGLGAIFGGVLEASGGAKTIANFMVSKFGLKRAPLAMVISGFLIAIPVFFDVAFIILVPMMYALQRRTGKSLLLYAIPLLAGLAITHAFIPPTPGPIAVADIIGVDLGWVICCCSRRNRGGKPSGTASHSTNFIDHWITHSIDLIEHHYCCRNIWSNKSNNLKHNSTYRSSVFRFDYCQPTRMVLFWTTKRIHQRATP